MKSIIALLLICFSLMTNATQITIDLNEKTKGLVSEVVIDCYPVLVEMFSKTGKGDDIKVTLTDSDYNILATWTWWEIRDNSGNLIQKKLLQKPHFGSCF